MTGLDKDIFDTLASLSDIPVKEREADKDTPYPYFVFETRRLSSDNGIDSYVLEVNGWDQHKYDSRIKAKLNLLENKLHTLKITNKDRSFVIYKGDTQMVTDEDKSIKRIREQFALTVCERG